MELMLGPVTSCWWFYKPITSVSPYPAMTNMFCNSTNNLNCSTMQHKYYLDRIRFMDLNLYYISTCESSCSSAICSFSSFLFDHTCKSEDLKVRLVFDLACSQKCDTGQTLELLLSWTHYRAACNHGDYLGFTSKIWANIVIRSQPQSKLLIRSTAGAQHVAGLDRKIRNRDIKETGKRNASEKKRWESYYTQEEDKREYPRGQRAQERSSDVVYVSEEERSASIRFNLKKPLPAQLPQHCLSASLLLFYLAHYFISFYNRTAFRIWKVASASSKWRTFLLFR